MILCFTTDDIGVLEDAYGGYDQRIFGIPYCYLTDHSYGRLLGQSENLFISAHGNAQEIGNQRGEPSYTPKQLATVLTSYVIPGRYTGNIYVSACGSAGTYVNGLLQALGAGYQGRVFGMFGDIDYQIAPPTDRGWRAAS